MSLNEYRKKRNFKKTAEPKAHQGRHNGTLHFVVQEHHASHLHYDFRLESHGVLKSWAVPKGVPADPSEKRLAIEVEDHPLDYQYFEGTIPEGNYGAGTVEIWDNGEYYVDKQLSREENEKEIEKELHKGHLTFYLNGKKLHGKYTLVKMHGTKGKKNQWLFMKKVSKEEERQKSLEDALAAPMPKSIKPMLATLTSKPFDRPKWIFEVKWDGYRILAEVKNHKVRLYSRNDTTYTQQFQMAARELGRLPDCVLDGEMVVVDEHGISRFQLLQNYMRSTEGQLIYYVFDIVYLDGRDVHQWPLRRRREALERLIPGSGIVRLSDSQPEKGTAFFKAVKDLGIEGIIAKNLESPYKFGQRSLDWLKIKAVQEQEAVIGGFTQPRRSRKFFGALILGIYKGKDLVYVGHTGGGFDDRLLKELYARLKPLATDRCPFKSPPKTNMPVTWVKPQLLCAVKFQEWTNDGHMRQPVFLGLRQDKKANEVRRENPTPVEKAVPKEKKTAVPKTKVAFSNLDKIFWPKEGYTKGDMVNYYQEIASYMLPHLKGRPQSMRRQPNGINDPGFFQKDINFKPPEWLKTFDWKTGSKGALVHHMICYDRNDLAFMNNLGCIEINPWCSTAEDPMHPDFMVLDFDPVNIDFKKVIDCVLTARELLVKARCDGFCKTSGSRGMHVYVPLKRKYTFEQTKDFCQILCMAINRQMPEITSLERSPQKRKGLIYLDYLQNHFGATMAAPYSLRPRPQAPVSAPLEWKEVKRSLRIEDFNIRTMKDRLKKKGDLWKGIFSKGINMQQSLEILTKEVSHDR